MISKTYTVIDYNELDALAQKVKPGFEFVDDYEANNDTKYSFSVTEKDVKEFNEAGGLDPKWVSVYDVITALVAAGDIPAGDILVEVSW